MFSEQPDKDKVFVQTVRDIVHKGVEDTNKAIYNVSVDDSLLAQIRNLTPHSMSASIEALYIILGFPDLGIGQGALSFNTFFEYICSFKGFN